MKIYHFFLLFIIISSSNLYAQTDLVSRLDTPEGATVYLKLLTENYKEGDELLLPIFIEKGADVNVINKNQVTPLVAMVNANSVEGVRILLEASAKTEMIFPIYYDTPITVAIKNAVKNKNNQILDLFLAANADVNFPNPLGDTPLITAIILNSTDMIEKLIRAGANPNKSNLINRSPLHAAVLKKDITMTERLLNAGANINAQSESGETPLSSAITFDPDYLRKNIEKLISAGADLNISNNKKEAPLHLAVEKNNLPVIKKLVNSGADIDAQTINGATALFIAASNGHLEAVNILVDAKANKHIGIKTGETVRAPVLEAREKGHGTIVQILEKNLPLCSGNVEMNDWSVFWMKDYFTLEPDLKIMQEVSKGSKLRFIRAHGNTYQFDFNHFTFNHDPKDIYQIFVDGKKIHEGKYITKENPTTAPTIGPDVIQAMSKGKNGEVRVVFNDQNRPYVKETVKFSLEDFEETLKTAERNMRKVTEDFNTGRCRESAGGFVPFFL